MRIKASSGVRASAKRVSVLVEWFDGDTSAFHFEYQGDEAVDQLGIDTRPGDGDRTEFKIVGPLVNVVKSMNDTEQK